MVVKGSGYKVGKGPYSKCKSRHVPYHDSIASPFKDLRKMVWAGNIPEQPSIGDAISIAAGLPKPDKHIVGTDIEAYAHTENDQSCDELRAGEPVYRISIRKIAPVVSQEKPVYGVKEYGH